MRATILLMAAALIGAAAVAQDRLPGSTDDGILLPNGWTITPFGDSVPMNDLISNIVPTPDGGAMIALHSGYNPHGLVVIDAKTRTPRQQVPLPTSWLGLAFNPAGDKLYVSGGGD
jgi:DNA-binding beta-propeller fold protein YncE